MKSFSRGLAERARRIFQNRRDVDIVTRHDSSSENFRAKFAIGFECPRIANARMMATCAPPRSFAIQYARKYRDALFGEGVWTAADARPELDIPNWNFKFATLLSIKLKHKVGRKTFSVALHCLVQIFSGHAV